MYREILESLVEWKEKGEKVLLLAGAKGVGKSYTLRDFGEGCFDGTAVIDLKKQEYIRVFFEEKLNREKLISILEIACGEKLVSGSSLIAVENIDCVSDVTAAVRFLSEEMSDYHVIITSSVREDRLLKREPELADMTDIIRMYPLSFNEFLNILGMDGLCSRIESNSRTELSMEDRLLLDEYVRKYIYVGGMPSVVRTYADTRNMQAVENEKQRLLGVLLQELDDIEPKAFKSKVIQVWNSIPVQLEKENKKFQFGTVKLTARAREYSEAVEWLYDMKYIDRVYRAKDIGEGMQERRDEKSYEVYPADVGLLAAMYGMTYEEIAEAQDISSLKQGALTEQYVYGELTANRNIRELYYWISEATARIEFLFEDAGAVIPVEINLNGNAKAQSIKVYKARYNPDMYISISKDSMSMADGVMRLPLYALWNL